MFGVGTRVRIGDVKAAAHNYTVVVGKVGTIEEYYNKHGFAHCEVLLDEPVVTDWGGRTTQTAVSTWFIQPEDCLTIASNNEEGLVFLRGDNTL